MRKLFTLAFTLSALFVNAQIVYVNTTIGDDSYDGLAATVSGNNGPKRTINAGVEAVNAGEVLVVESGVYNENVVFNKSIQLVKTGNNAVEATSFTFTDAATLQGNPPVDGAFQSPTVTIQAGSSANDGYLFVAENGALYLNGSSFSDILFVNKSMVLVPIGNVDLAGIRMNGNSAVLTLGGDLTITGSLQLNQLNGGFLELSAFDLTVANGANLTMGSAGSFVRTSGTGNLILETLTDQTTVLPIGTGIYYTPLTIDDANNTGETIGARVRSAMNTNSFNPDLPGGVNSFVALEWALLESGAGGNNARIRFDYTGNAELNNWPAAQNRIVARNDGSTWSNGTDISINEAFASATFNSLGGTFAIYSDFPNAIINAQSATAQVYPNPFSQELFVNVPEGISAAPFTLTDLSGRIVQVGVLNGNKLDVQTDLPSGAYLLVLDLNGTPSVSRLMKK